VARVLAAASATLLALTVLAAPVPAFAEPAAPGVAAAPASASATPVSIDRPLQDELVRWPTARGQAPGATTVELRRGDGKLLGTSATWGDGRFEVQPVGYLGSGSLSFRVVGIDAGGVRTSSELRTVRVDRTLLDRPQLLAGPGPISLSDWSIGYVGATRIVRGVGVRGTAVNATLDGVAIAGSADVGANYQWKLRLPDSAAEGQHAFVLTLTDQAGHHSLPLSATITLDVQVPAAPTISSPKPDAVLPDAPRTVGGTGEPGIRLAVFVDGHYLGWTPVNEDGRWITVLNSYDVGGRGGHWLAVNQQDRSGNKSERTGIRYVVRPSVAADDAPTTSAKPLHRSAP
jgi:hypothetical protein